MKETLSARSRPYDSSQDLSVCVTTEVKGRVFHRAVARVRSMGDRPTKARYGAV
jgi:hypothetical protein